MFFIEFLINLFEEVPETLCTPGAEYDVPPTLGAEAPVKVLSPDPADRCPGSLLFFLGFSLGIVAIFKVSLYTTRIIPDFYVLGAFPEIVVHCRNRSTL